MGWESACFLGSVSVRPRREARLSGNVLLIDSAGDAVRVRASGWTVHEVVAFAEPARPAARA